MRSTVRITSLMAICGALAAGAASLQAADELISAPQSEIYLKDPGGATNVPGASATVKSLQPLNVGRMKSLAAAPKTAPQLDAAARGFVDDNAAELGIAGNEASLTLKSVQPSLTGTVVEYQQTLDGVPILNSQLGVSLDPNGDVSSVTKNIVRVPASKRGLVATRPKLTDAEALDVVQADLKPAGKTMEPPSVAKAYLYENNALTLVYVVRVAVEQPFGYWEYRIDAQTGRIVQRFDRRIKRVKREGDVPPPAAALAPLNLADSLKKAEAAPRALTAAGTIVSSTGKVFSPNPVTSLGDGNLKDDDPAMTFTSAYTDVPLTGVTKMGTVLHLTGPVVQLADFESGEGGRSVPPATATDKWVAVRGDNAFNDVMTFSYLTQSIEYMRKLGYKDAADLFKEGIAADSDGLNGDDNSHFVPGSDRLAFGHGCVDDNEDTDVIRHELGHAIHTHINPQWGGGDSGAIGEGFGDYWAVSYRMRLASGLGPDPGKVFPWDGIPSCWGGRRVDMSNAVYNPSRTYGAHQSMGGFESDELWSTPLVRAASDIVAGGASIEDADKIVLEGMFGMGPNFTMRTLAANTVLKARQLFPDKPYASLFETRFKQHKILE